MHIHRIEVYPEDSVIHPSKNRGVIGKLPTTRRLLVVMQRFLQRHCNVMHRHATSLRDDSNERVDFRW